MGARRDSCAVPRSPAAAPRQERWARAGYQPLRTLDATQSLRDTKEPVSDRGCYVKPCAAIANAERTPAKSKAGIVRGAPRS